MPNNQNQPREYDSVLGGNSPSPIYGIVLGGIEGVRYDEQGLDLIIQSLQDESSLVRRSAYQAYKLLKKRAELNIQEALQKLPTYEPWVLQERLPYRHYRVTFAMGTLGNDAAQVLLDCPKINNLDKLILSDNFLSMETIKKSLKLDVRVYTEEQKEEDKDYYINGRYCSVAE